MEHISKPVSMNIRKGINLMTTNPILLKASLFLSDSERIEREWIAEIERFGLQGSQIVLNRAVSDCSYLED